MTKISEVKLFSNVSSNKRFGELLKGSSVSAVDANARTKVYEKVFSNYEIAKDAMKMFSGASEAPLLSNQYFDATVASYVNSFAGFLSIERALDNPEQLISFYDVLGVSDNRKVLPNLGAEDLAGMKADVNSTTILVGGTTTYSIALAKKLIPGSVKISLIHDATGLTEFTITDDGAGSLVSKPGVLASGTINYATGLIDIDLGSAFTIAANDTAVIRAFEDQPGTPALDGNSAGAKNRVKAQLNNIRINSYPDILMAEHDLASFVGMNKAIGVDPMTILSDKLIELYTKIINEQLVGLIVNNYEGNSIDFDIQNSTTAYSDFRSTLDNFCADLVEVDTALAVRSVKGIRATCYLVSYDIGGLFQKTASIGKFVKNTESTYIDDLLGFYDGIPVLRHADVPAGSGYAIHKTFDGQMAPLARGIFLPLTTTPVVGNYQNPTQMAQGLYYQEGSNTIATELTQKFTFLHD